MKRTILIVDSVDKKREDLKELFSEDYTILEAKNGEQAIAYLEDFKNHLSLVLINFVLQKRSGMDVVEYMNVHKYIDDIPVIMTSGEEEETQEERALELGVSEFIYRPFHKAAVVNRCERIMGINENKLDIEAEVHKANTKLTTEYNQLKCEHVASLERNKFMVDALSSAVEFKNLSSEVHNKRIKLITRILMNRIVEMYPKYELTGEDIDMIVEAVSLHDIGKVCISDSILFKPGKLTKEEYEEMKMHTVYGCALLEPFKNEDSKFYKYCYDICRYHHERADGGGYPDNLQGDEIPIWAQAVSIADVFDALVSQRVYKEAYEVNMAIALIYNGECGKFSDEIMSAFESREEEIFATIDL